MSPTLGLFAREVLLEWFVDLFLGHWSGEHDLYGLGVLRGNNRARSVIHRTQQSTSGGGNFNWPPGERGVFYFLFSPPPRPLPVPSLLTLFLERFSGTVSPFS